MPLAFALAAGAFAAGCGTSGSSTTKRSGAATNGSGSVNKPEARVYARAVNLTPADVPELTSVAPEAETKVKLGGIEAEHCAGGENPYLRVVDMKSARFRGASASPSETVTSDVTVWPNSAMAAQDFAAQRSQRGRVCAEHLLERSINRFGRVRVSRLAVSWLPPPLATAAQGSYAVHASMVVEGRSRGTENGPSAAALESASPKARLVHVPLYFDALGFRTGAAEIELTELAIKRPASAAAERRLLSLLYSRATAHKL